MTPQDMLLAAFRVRLQSDPQLRREFDSAPLGVLRRAGVPITPAEALLLRTRMAGGPIQPPVSTISMRGAIAGQKGWLIAPVTVALSARDFSGTGVATIETSQDGVTWTTYAEPITYAAEGVTRLYYRARDHSYTEEQPQSQEFRIDTRPPALTVRVDRPAYTRLQSATVHVSANDPGPGSGLAALSSTLDDSPVSDGQIIDLFWYPLGTYVLSATASDMAGSSTKASMSFDLVATHESLVGLVRRLTKLGEIEQAGLARSLDAKAEHGQLTALLHEVRAQSGKHITARAADLLLSDAEYLLAHDQHNEPTSADPSETAVIKAWQ